ncbi:BA75_03861T0 [Komagataella pastoris]|uniref:Nucleolar complex-associated protein 3 n=1 Tax=Komagataella pastoris TaxID=4922 RepID=A0A1B2JH31_PICPA|nr:BA75_03861T0 [Komagataella pastoris]
MSLALHTTMAKRREKTAGSGNKKRQKQNPNGEIKLGVFTRNNSAQAQNDNWENQEQDYELQSRSLNYSNEQEEGLPIKRQDGRVERKMRDKQVAKKAPLENDKEQEERSSKDLPEETSKSQTSYSADPIQKKNQVKEEISKIAELLLEDSEEHIDSIIKVLKMAQSKDSTVSKLALLALTPIFKNMAPSYRIRPLTDLEKKEKVSKDVGKLRHFEQSLVIHFKTYLDLLDKATRTFSTTTNATPYQISLGRSSSIAVCELAQSMKFFNYRAELIDILIKRVCRKPQGEKDLQVFKKCVETLENLLTDDIDRGDISADIVRILCKRLRARSYMVDESLVNIFLSASILRDYDPMNKDTEEKPKLKKKDRVHLSNSQRKQRKELQKIDEELKKAEEAVTAEQREKFQAEILRTLLKLYLDMLQQRPESLMAPVLEGLARYGHMVNFDMLGDFLQVLRELSGGILSTSPDNNLTGDEIRQVLLCVVTAFALLSNHSQHKVNIDLSSFVATLYAVLPLVAQDPDIEFSHKSLRLADPLTGVDGPASRPSVNVSTKAELVLKALDSVFFASRSSTSNRVMAFTKRLYMTMLHTPEKTTIALLKFMEKLSGRFSEVAGLYSTEDTIANGVYNAETDNIERSNAACATLWENELLRTHYCPTVQLAARTLANRSRKNNN